jgi:MoxR-like ATPase
MLRLRLAEQEGKTAGEIEDLIFGRSYLLERPLLRAITRKEGPPVLLIDEIDRADDGFEAFLLEVLSDFQVTTPELGTIRAEHLPYVILTSNRTREIGDALRRRCLYLYIEHPSLEKEVRILHARVPGASARLAETIDWAQALLRLHSDHLDRETVEQTLGCILKDHNDLREINGGAAPHRPPPSSAQSRVARAAPSLSHSLIHSNLGA